MKPAPFLKSRRLEFRTPEPDDAPRLAGWVNDPEVRRHLDQRAFPMSVLAERDWIEGLRRRVDAKTDLVLVVHRQSDTEPLGSCGLHGIHWLARWAEFGLLLAREHWGQGYGREITERMLDYAFDELNLEALRLRVNVSHERARKCYDAVGYKEEGVLRKAAYIDGHYEDMVVMSMLRAEWAERKEGDGSVEA